ncbi:MAG: SH3 domain-containing protein [Methylovirgula sp.]
MPPPRFRLRLFIASTGLLTLSMPAQAAGTAADLPIPGQSWGGVVRSGPGMSFAKIGTLREKDPVTILARTGVMWNDYEWFKIRYRAHRVGYQWGGILCPIGAPIQGTYQVCKAPHAAAAQK